MRRDEFELENKCATAVDTLSTGLRTAIDQIWVCFFFVSSHFLVGISFYEYEDCIAGIFIVRHADCVFTSFLLLFYLLYFSGEGTLEGTAHPRSRVGSDGETRKIRVDHLEQTCPSGDRYNLIFVQYYCSIWTCILLGIVAFR